MERAESRKAAAPATPLAGGSGLTGWFGLVGTVGLAAASWVIAVRLMHGMDMGVTTRPGSFPFFVAAWVPMMAAMMLPGAAPAVASQGRIGAAALFAAAYLGVWTLAGLVAYVLDRPHGTLAAGLVVIAAGIYELTPVKRAFRRRCREQAGSGLGYGLCCAGSSLGLMAMLVALDVMSLFWMAMIAAVTCVQKLLSWRAVIDVPVALALTALGLVIVIAPHEIPGLLPAMPAMPAMPTTPTMSAL